jgi:perosamine synthetase
MAARLLPKHSPDLQAADFATYLLRRRRAAGGQPSLADAWHSLLPDRVLLGTPSGRHALWQYLVELDLPAGAEVLVGAYNYYVIVRILIQLGLRPVFVDIEADTLGMDPEDLRRKISPASRLVLATHMFGIPADVARIADVCREHGLLLFEDCAHAVGTMAGGCHVGRFGDAALFSFGPFKSVTCFGGGMLAAEPAYDVKLSAAARVPVLARMRTAMNMLVALTSSPRLYGCTLAPLTRLARRLAGAGFTPLRDLVAPSKDNGNYVFRADSYAPFEPFMTEMLRAQLRRLENRVALRRMAIAGMKQTLAGISQITLLREDKHGCANGSYFGIYVPDSEGFTGHMRARGVEVNPHEFYDCAGLSQFGDYASDCPNAAYASQHLVRLPSYSGLDARDLARIATAASDYFGAQPAATASPEVTKASARACSKGSTPLVAAGHSARPSSATREASGTSAPTDSDSHMNPW